MNDLSTFQLVIVAVIGIIAAASTGLLLLIGVVHLAAIVRDERMLAEDKRRKRRSVIPDLTDYIDEHQSDDAPEFRPVQRDAENNIKLRRY